MAYNANQLVTINNNPCYILLDRYGQRSKKHVNIGSASSIFSFYTDFNDLGNIRKQHPKAKVYGFWHLLYHNKKIDIEKEEDGFIVYKPNSKNGFYFFYNKTKGEFLTGIVLKDKAIGAFTYDLDKAVIIDADINKLDFPKESILLPTERKKLKTQQYQKIAIQHFLLSLAIAASFYFFDIMYNVITNKDEELKAELSQVKLQRDQAQVKLNTVKSNHYNVKKTATHPLVLQALVPIASLNVSEIKIPSMAISTKSFAFSFEGIESWMSELLSNHLFAFSQKTNKGKKPIISINWKAK